MDDDVLAKRALRDADAFAELYQRYLHRVYSYLRAKVGNVQDAQDLTTQTFIAALESLPSYSGRGKFAAWLLSIARHKALNFLRQSPYTLPLEAASEMAHEALLTEDMVVLRLELDQAIAAVRQLAPDRNEVLVLRIFGELSVAEISSIMGRSEAAVRMLLHRALADLRQQVTEKDVL